MKIVGIMAALALCGAGLGAQTAALREARGDVEVRTPGGVWHPALAGESLPAETIISTGFEGTALLELGSSTLTVRPLTRLSITELILLEGSEHTRIDLRAGRVRADVSPPSGGTVNFTLRSPTITASVRGTVFEFDGLSLRTHEGRVHIAGNGGSGAYVGAGQRAGADPETGLTASAAETLRETLSPPLPPGLDRVAETSATAAARVLTGEVVWE
jgi:hypothetical protein